jgi:hypothetical protein
LSKLKGDKKESGVLVKTVDESVRYSKSHDRKNAAIAANMSNM